MKKIVMIIILSLSNFVFAYTPIDTCLENVDIALRIAGSNAAAGGYAGTPRDITNRMTIAMSKGNCYGEIEKSKLCLIKLEAMLDAGRRAAASGGSRVPDSDLIQEAKKISGC
ncbi:TPA: hypothetical protein ACT9MK_002685 [Legionella pneumophila]|nr:hypothetical protein [Legionella pneumophila]HDV5789216.1 hypothetical protein [Legionella pneumophila]HDV5798198.1 hypothetical protein [Legionella pneumophila]